MALQDLLTNPVYLGIGATLGFALAAVQIYEFFMKGAKISAVLLEANYTNSPVVLTTVQDNRQIMNYSALASLKIQIQNSGTELTSVTSTHLVLPDGIKNRSKVTQIINAGPFRVPNIVTDDRTIVLDSGVAIIEIFDFEFNISENDYKNSNECNLVFNFVNHKEVKVPVSFKPYV